MKITHDSHGRIRENETRDAERAAEDRAAEYIICRWCGTPTDVDNCPKCKRKVTVDPLEPRRDKDLVDMCRYGDKPPIRFRGIPVHRVLELMNIGNER